jgi:hypothetical protein
MMYELRIATPATPVALAASWYTSHELSVELPDGFATMYARVDVGGNPEWGMPIVTTVHVAAEVWRDGVDDDGDGEPVTDAAGLAALLGCEATEIAVARHLNEVVTDHLVGQEELRHG